MSQYDFAPLDADSDDGTKLVADLNSWVPAVLSTHAGTTRPTYVRQGMVWCDNSGSPELILNLFDGVLDRELFRVSPGGTISSGEQATVWSEIIPGHNFAPYICVFHNGTSWSRAIASNPATVAQAMVRSVNGTRVTFQSNGIFEEGTGLIPGSAYYLSSVTAGELTRVPPTTGYVQLIMVALSSTRSLINVQPAQTVGGVVLLRPGITQNVIQSNHPDAWPLYLQRRADQRVGLLALLNEGGGGIGGIDKDGYPWGTMAPTAAQQIPPGTFVYFFGTAPTGWLEANGQAIDAGYTVLRSKFGANMPDWRGKFVIAATPPFFSLGTTGGAYSAALSAANMPNELQVITSVGMAPFNNRPGLDWGTDTSGTHTTVNSTAFRGGSALFSIVPPWAAITLICKAG